MAWQLGWSRAAAAACSRACSRQGTCLHPPALRSPARSHTPESSKILLWSAILGAVLGLTQLMLVTGALGVGGGGWGPALPAAGRAVHAAGGPAHHPPAASPPICLPIYLHLPLPVSQLTRSPIRPLPPYPTPGFNRQLGLSDELFALADTALLTVLGQVAFMPLLVLAARVCPEVRVWGRQRAGAQGLLAAGWLEASRRSGSDRRTLLAPWRSGC